MSAEQKRELFENKELKTFAKYSVVEVVSRQGISPSALMKIRGDVTLKDGGQLKARLLVQGFTDQRLGKTPTSSPTAFRRSCQNFLTYVASLGFQSHKGDVKCAFLQGDVDEQHVDDTTMRNFINMSQRNRFPTRSTNQFPGCLESCEWSITSVVRLFKAVYGFGQRSKKMVSSSCHRSSDGTLLVDFPRRKWCHSGPVLGAC